MTKKVIFDEKLPHISLDTVDDVKHQKLKRGFGGFDSKPINQDQFKNMLGTVVSVGSVISSRFKNTYFLMDLTTEYYSPAVSDMLDSLKLEIKTVISENQIIVKGDKDTLEEIGTQKKILKKITNPIKKMYLLDESDKLGQDLFKLIKKDVDSIKVFPIIIKLIDNINEDEEFEFKKILDDELKKEISPQYLKKTHNYICGSNSKRIIEIAKLPFIKKISKIPQIEAQNVSEDLLYSKEDYVKMPKNVYERCEENKRKGNSRELFLQSYHNLREVMCSRNESTERKYVVFQGFLQDYIRCDLTEADITTAQSIIKEFEMRMAYEPFVQHPELKRRAEIILAQKRRKKNKMVERKEYFEPLDYEKAGIIANTPEWLRQHFVQEAQKELIDWSEEWFDESRTSNDMWRMNQDELTSVFLEELKKRCLK